MTSLTAASVSSDDLDAGYSGAVALNSVSFTAMPGDRVALLGPNGGGKTTLIKTLSGELEPINGSFTLDGRAGLVPQHDPIQKDWPATTLDLAICGTLASLPWWRVPLRAERKRAAEALEAVGLSEHASTLCGELSGGQRRRAQIAAALAGGSKILLLDEPFAGLDNVSSEQLERLLESLSTSGVTLLIATHDLDQARSWEKVLCLNGRQVAFGEPTATLTRVVLEATFGSDLLELPGGGLIAPPHHHHHH